MMTADILIIPPFSYTMGAQTNNQWTHQAFPVPHQELCGGLTYTATLGDLAVAVTHTVATKSFVIYSNDLSLPINSPYTYTVESQYIYYPGYGKKTAQGTVILLDECSFPSMCAVGVAQNANTNGNAPAVFTFPSATVHPVTCIDRAAYTCQYVDGPFTGDSLDECNLDTILWFDNTSGTLSFNPGNQIEVVYPEGQYNFLVTMTVGDCVLDVDVTIIVNLGCADGELNLHIVHQPPQHVFYTVDTEQMVLWSFNMNTIVISSDTGIIPSPITGTCGNGYYWSHQACMCFAEIQLTVMCQPGFQLDPRNGGTCILQETYDALFENCDYTCAEGATWNMDACKCFADIQCAMACAPATPACLLHCGH
jgi:hypothetical protein